LTATGPRLGIVIPTLDEQQRLPGLLDDLSALTISHRVIVSDGGSVDRTVEVALRSGAEVVRTERGRARQMNAGARMLPAVAWLLFLHADTRVSPAAVRCIEEWVGRDAPEAAGFFRFALDGSGWFWRFIEFGQRLRERFSGLAYGDQGLLVTNDAFWAVGGYPDQPLMEDVEMIRRLRGSCGVEPLPAAILTSPRRYEEYGRWRGWLRNAALIALYLVGWPTERLARWYDPGGSRTGDDDPDSESRRVLIIFAKAPLRGHVKTRLAAEVGEEEAVRVYRTLGRRVVHQVRGGAYDTVVYYDPPGSLEEVRNWLGEEGMEFRPQATGDLGARMEAAFEEVLEYAQAACVIGTDAPEVDRRSVEEAFHALAARDVVFGPTEDGGYYLLGMTRARPELFRRIPWSTPRVLPVSRERVLALGLRPALLKPLIDVDRMEDLERLRLR
jgi:rSAM/selenodomain-associated transferase 2/rSAM/selenodomain-associated transferase 1